MNNERVAVVPRRTLLLSLVAIGVLAAAPFPIASIVGERRIATAKMQVKNVAAAIREAGGNVGDAHTLAGVGAIPAASGQPEWLQASAPLGSAVQAADLDHLSADPWRNAYLVNIGARRGVWVVSAGPNGIVETPFEGAVGPLGDDIGARVR